MTTTDESEVVGETIASVVRGTIIKEWANILAETEMDGVSRLSFNVEIVTSGFRNPHRVMFAIKPKKSIKYPIAIRNGEDYEEAFIVDNEEEIESGPEDPEGLP